MAGRRPRYRRRAFRAPRSRSARPRICSLPRLPAGRLIVIDGLAFGVMAETRRGAASDAQAGGAGASSARARNRPAGVGGGEIPGQRAARIVVRASRHHHQRDDRAAAGAGLCGAGGEAERGAAGQRPRCRSPSAAAGDVVNLLAVGSIVPRKGYDLLIAALGQIPDLPWRLVIAGDPGRSPDDRPGAGGADRRRCISPIAWSLPASCRPSGWRASMQAPTCSCCRRATKATAWPIPKRSRTACRWSGPPRARFRRRCQPAPACWSRRTTSASSH